MRTVNLVATEATIQRFFHGSPKANPASKPGIMSADFPVVPETCKTALGRWLADVIVTTRFDDDASNCSILLPATEQGLHFREFGEHLQRKREIRSIEEAERALREVEAWVQKQRNLAKVYGETTCRYRVIQFSWPVFGSAAAHGADTPEGYFDLCAGQIRSTGGVILKAGLGSDQPPESIVRTMASKSGGGDALLKRYHSRVAKEPEVASGM